MNTPLFVFDFTKNVISLLLFTIMGVTGAVSDVEVREYGIIAETTVRPSFAFGSIAYVGTTRKYNPHVKNHEYGHLIHEKELRFLYLPIAALTSSYGNLIGMDADTYYGMWTEKMADELGGVHR